MARRRRQLLQMGAMRACGSWGRIVWGSPASRPHDYDLGFSMETVPPKLGPIGIVSQAARIAYYEARDRHLGVSLWATTGNGATSAFRKFSYYAADDALRSSCSIWSARTASFMAGSSGTCAAAVIVTKVGASDVGAEAALSHCRIDYRLGCCLRHGDREIRGSPNLFDG